MRYDQANLLDHHTKYRAAAIAAYKAAFNKARRDDARGWALHHGRLMRKLAK